MKLSLPLIVTICLAVLLPVRGIVAETFSLQELGQKLESLPEITIYQAKDIITMNPDKPKAHAVAVAGDRILAVGSTEELVKAAGKQPYKIDTSFAHMVITPGLIAQHLHPLLSALTMTSEIIAIEDWVLPSGTVQAVRDRDSYLKRLTETDAKLKDPDELLFTWGFHHYFHGKLTRAHLDKINAKRPIIVWHRSCHEFILNTPAMEKYDVTRAEMDKWSDSAKAQSNYDNAHFWEQGGFAILPHIASAIATPERLKSGLEFTKFYLHANGITAGCEPGGLISKQLQEAQNAILSGADTPFRFYFIPDGKTLAVSHRGGDMIGETEKLLSWGKGMTKFLPKQVKLFADGAIYSQLMQMKDGYLDGHHGEWLMDLDVFAEAFKTYWNAGYQIHVHTNGDAGLDMVLANLESSMRANPRKDHRTIIVHFGFSTIEQVRKIKQLGAIVSANPYYVNALADRYGEVGIGKERADEMVRLGDVERAGISYSFHSDMPMAPAQPLYLMHNAVNRTTVSGRVAGPAQRVSREGALKAITIEAAFSLQLEKEIGSIKQGKLANFTILHENPLTVAAEKIKDIKIWGTVHEGRVLPISARKTAATQRPNSIKQWIKPVALTSVETHDHDYSPSCICTTSRSIARIFLSSLRTQNAPGSTKP